MQASAQTWGPQAQSSMCRLLLWTRQYEQCGLLHTKCGEKAFSLRAEQGEEDVRVQRGGQQQKIGDLQRVDLISR